MAETIALALWEAGFAESAVFALANAGAINAALIVGANYAHGQDQRRRLRNQARDAFNASLQDRQLTIRSAVAPRGVLYGRDKVGGQLTDAFVTGTKGEFLHLVMSFYGHECDACETIYFNNIALPAPDGSGFIQSGEFAKTNTLSTTETTTSGSIVLANTPTVITSVTKLTGPDVVNGVLESLTSPTGYTLAGSTVTFAAGAGPTYTVNYDYQTQSAKVRVKVHLGQSGQTADSDLVAESGGRWTSSDVGTGIAYIYFRLEYDNDVFGQIGLPGIEAAWRGKKLFDHRSGLTVWSDNAALATRDWLRDATYGLGCTSAEVPDAEIDTEANTCDEEVTLYSTGTVTVTNGSKNVTGSGTSWATNCYPGLLFVSTDGVRYTVASVTDSTHLVLTANYGGTSLGGQSYSLRQKRYTVNGTLGTENAPRDNLRRLLGAMAGTAIWVQGRWRVRAGSYVTPAITLNEDYLSRGAITIVPRASRRDQFNRVSGTYLDGNALYTEKQYPAVVNTTYKTADGGLELTREISLWGVTDSFRAQRLAKVALERSRQAMTVKFTTNWRAYDLAPGDTFNFTLARYGWSSKVFEVRSRRLVPGNGIEYTAIETASTVWSWNLGEQTVYSAAAATNLPNPFAVPATLGSLACNSSATVNGSIGSTIVPRGLVTWTASTDVFVQQGGRIEIQWKLWSDVDWQKAPPVPGDSTSTYISPLQPIGITLIRARAVNAAGRAGLWSTITHTVASGGVLGGGNLLTNSSFEVDSNADGLADGWSTYTAGTTGALTPALVSGGVFGGFHQQLTAANLGTGAGDQAGIYTVIELSNLDGRAYSYSAYLNGIGAGAGSVDIRLYIDFYGSAGGTGSVTGSDDVLVSRPTNAVWQRRVLTGTIPAGTASARVYIWQEARGTSAGTAVGLRVDALQFEVGAVLTAYAPKTDEILAGAVGTTQIADGAATTGKLATNAATEIVSDSGSVGYSFTDTGAGFQWRVQRLQQISWTNSTSATITVELSAEIQGTRSAGAGSVYLDVNQQFSSAMTSNSFSSVGADTLHTDATSGYRRYTYTNQADVSAGSTIYLATTAIINTAASTTTDYSGDARLRIVVIKR